MTDTQARAAYKQQPPPNDLAVNDELPYIMLKELYNQHKKQLIDVDMATRFKNILMNYENSTLQEKMLVLNYTHDCLAMETNRENAMIMVQLMTELTQVALRYF